MKNEPIAFFDPQEKGFYWAQPTKITAPTIVDVEPLALYTQRAWVGLTDEEIVQMGLDNYRQVVREAEAKLKEKNETH